MTLVSGGDVPFISVESLSKRFGAEWALAHATFSLGRGEMALLTGSNGSGKTTLIRCLSTAVMPDFGRASIGGHDLVEARVEVRKQVATLSQPAGFYGGLSARENLALTDALLGLGSGSSISPLLDRMGLTSRKDAPLDEFSSGMKQRFALARLCLVKRSLVLLDEPETHLDSAGLILLAELIAEWKATGTAVICATHAPERFQSAADQQIRLISGRPDDARGAH